MTEEREKALAVFGQGLPPTPCFIFPWPEAEGSCPECGRPRRLLATQRRRVISLAYGEFVAVERQGYCPAHPDLPPARSRDLPRLVPRGSKIAYDILVYVGLARFLECRQIQEIRTALSNDHQVNVAPTTISHMAKKFVAYAQVVHQESIPLLRDQMRNRGGYILHVDGTCEEGSRVLLVCVDSLSGQVLESRKVTSENTEDVARVLRDVRRDWGIPLAVVHDLRDSLMSATREVFPGVRQFVCHFHLAADVGKDILSGHVDRLRDLFRRTRLRPRLGALRRSLRRFAVPEDRGEHVVHEILASKTLRELREHATPEGINGAIHALASWILAFTRSGEGYGFPFDLPYLSLYERVVEAYRVLDGPSVLWPEGDRGATATLRRFKAILEPVVTGEEAEEFAQVIAETRKNLKVFERFRRALRICPKGGKNRRNDEGASALSPNREKASLKSLRRWLERKARRDVGARRACEIVLEHLERYWEYLFGHVVAKEPQTIVVPRTNNVEERLFRTIKRQCRRLHGRGHLTRDVDAMAAGTALLLNLRNPAYCETVYGGSGAKEIARRFSEVDPACPAALLKLWKRERLSTSLPRKLEKTEDLPERLARFIAVVSEQAQEPG